MLPEKITFYALSPNACQCYFTVCWADVSLGWVNIDSFFLMRSSLLPIICAFITHLSPVLLFFLNLYTLRLHSII